MYEEIMSHLQLQEYETAATLAGKLTSEELAVLLRQIDKKDLPVFCRALDPDALADALVLLETELQEDVINGLRDDELEKVLDEMSVDDTVEIIEDMPQEIVRRIAELDDILKLLEDRNYAVLKPLLSSMNAIASSSVSTRLTVAIKRDFFSTISPSPPSKRTR